MATVIQTDRISRTFGSFKAVDDVDLAVEEGTVLGVLGPNGAGKTTLVRMLTTLVHPTSGSANVGGFDVTADPAAVRSLLGLTGQYAAVDEHLTGRENLVLFGQLLGLNRKESRQRADRLLDRFGLGSAGSRRAGTYSGGMRRRLDLAASLIGRPRIVFLDEPTTGLDPRSRTQLWEVVRDLVAEGTTVFLTTQYLEEADELADRIVVLDDGQVVAEGTAAQLKARIGGKHIEIETTDAASAQVAHGALTVAGLAAEQSPGRHRLLVTVRDSGEASAAISTLHASGIDLQHLEVRSPSLDDVFMTITGGSADALPGAA